MTLQPYDAPTNLPALSPQIDGWISRLEPAIRLTELTFNSEQIPPGFRGKKGDVLAAFIRSGELNLSPFTGISQMHTINGRVGISAELMRALIMREGHDLHVEVSDATRCTISGHRSTWAEDRWTTVTWTIDDASKAGLLEDKRGQNGRVTPSMYRRWPAAMLLARATTTLARMVFPDVIAGLRSTEELQEIDDGLEAAGYVPAAPPTATVSRQPSSGSPVVVEAEAPHPGGVGASEEVGAAEPQQQPAAPAAAGRRRAALKPRGKAAPEPASDAEPVVAEVVEAVGAELAGAVTDVAVSPDDWRRRTTAQVQMQWQRLLGMPVQRDERLFWTGVLVGRPVESTNDLEEEELATLLNRLGQLRNLDALEALNRQGGSDA